MKEALEMNPEERQTRHAQLYRHVTTNTGKLWTDSFLTELVAEADMERLRQSMVAPLLDESAFIKDYAMVAPGRKRVILIDYDAILPSFKNISYSHETIKSLKNCLALISAEDTGNIVVLVSERSAEQLEHTLAGLENIILCAENGCCARFPGQPGWRNLVAEPDPLWWERVQTILEYYTERTPGAWIEHKRAAYVWHYDHADAVFGARQAKECQAHVQDALGANCPVHAVAVRKRLQIRLRTVSQRQAVGSMLKATLTGDLDVGFVAVFMRTRDDEDLFQYCREVVGRSLGLLPSSSPVLPIGSPLNPIESSSSSPLKRWATFETDRPLYICAVGETLTLQADQRVVSACSLLRLLTRAHLEHN